MKNSVTRKLSGAKSFAAAVMLLLALAVAFGGRTVTAQAAVKTSRIYLETGKSVSFKTSDYSKVTSSNSKVLKVTKKNGKWVVTGKKAGSYFKEAKLSMYKKGKLSEKIFVEVWNPSKLICVGKSVSYKASEYSKVTSSNSKALKVTKKNGKWVVTAKKSGYEVLLKLYKKGKLSKRIVVVTAKTSEIKADTSSKTVKSGSKFTWNPKGDDYLILDCRYSSSDTSVLSVNGDGVCTAKDPGTVTVTMKLAYGATTFKTYKRKVTVKALKTSEKEVVKKTLNVPIATLEGGYNKTYINKNNIKMLDTCNIIPSDQINGSEERALVYTIKSNSLTNLKITGSAAELANVTDDSRYVNLYGVDKIPAGTNWYNKWEGVTEVYIRTNSTGKAVLTAEDYTHVYKITFNVVGMSNKSNGTLYTGWVNEGGYVLNPDKAGAKLQPNIAGGDTNTAAHTRLVYKGRFAKTAKEMQAAAKVNCTPIKKFLKSEDWDDLDDFEKVKQIREFLFDGENLTYGQNKNVLFGWSLVMYGKDGVCSDYSEAVSVLCKLLGLDVVEVSNGEHEWPLVKINGKWYDADLMNGSALNYESVDYYDTLSTSLRYREMREGLIEYRTLRPSDKVYGYKGWNRSIISRFGGKVITEDI